MATDAIAPLNVLAGELLSAVTFVQDYLQLSFDNKHLTTYQWPVIVTGTGTLSIDDSGFRDALCSFIGTTVADLAETVDSIVIRFAVGSLHINLTASQTEQVIFEDLDAKTWAWW